MFTFATDGKVWWRVNLPLADESGEVIDAPVLLLYRIYTRAELKARERSLQGALSKMTQSIAAVGSADNKGAGVDSVAAALADVETIDKEATEELTGRVCDWKEIVDGDGNPVKFSKSTLKAILAYEGPYRAIAAGLLEASRGASAKNSLPGPAGSRAPAPN